MDLGTSIIEHMNELSVPYGHLAVLALGQQGYLLKGGSRTVVIDPYLSNYVEELMSGSPEQAGFARRVPIVVRPEQLDMVDVILCSHHHEDHCDPQTLLPLLSVAPQARLLASYSARDVLKGAGVEASRITVPVVGRAAGYGEGLTVTVIPSAHYGFEPDADGNPAYLGFIVTLNGVTFYHSGDSLVYEGLLERLRAQRLDRMFLPINGRDRPREQQGIIGNMDHAEAAELAAAGSARVLIPGHYDMFTANSVNPAHLLDYLQAHHPHQRVHFLRAGELYYYVSSV